MIYWEKIKVANRKHDQDFIEYFLIFQDINWNIKDMEASIPFSKFSIQYLSTIHPVNEFFLDITTLFYFFKLWFVKHI